MLKEKIKPIHLILILIIIIVYGYLFGLFSGSEKNADFIQLEEIRSSQLKKDVKEFPLHRNDPFLSKRKKIRKTQIKKVNPQPVHREQMAEVKLPFFKIIGISENDKKKQISLEMNNKFFLLNEKEVFFGIKILEIARDSLSFSYLGKTFKQKRPRF